MWNAQEYIEDMVAVGFDKETAIAMAREESAKRKHIQRTNGVKINNDHHLGMRKERAPIVLPTNGNRRKKRVKT